MSTAESKSEVVLALAEEFLERYRRGERPPLTEYTDRHPDLAADIHEVFPAMAMMENIALADESVGGGPGDVPSSPPLQRLGDFRIIREVGRGGMGVVYEAEQISLGRHVALKVLPRQVVRDAKQRQRFEREAKSAAKLHHTNIVPVHGVGEHDGTPYYVMQFIQGLGLDEVIAELSRIAPGSPPSASKPDRRSAAARTAARSMMTGQFGAVAEDDDVHKPVPVAATLTVDGGIPDPPAAEVPMTGSGHATAVRRADTAILSSVTLPGQSESGVGRKSRKLSFWQSVARVGAQVADALEHAHRQGVVHRDVKPSNLLLDLDGTVWVTDFGLAKADDQQNLTHTGDILGTLRYMPPEAFHGKADARGDVYSLGLTLYELASLRPAFDEKDRLGLVRQVTEEEPPPLRKIRPDVPRDLETIIYKAIEKSAGHRYQTAADLAADFQRFLDDEPILARRLTGWERARRWCRRNPLVAALIGVIQLTLVGLIVLGAWSNARISRALGDAETARSEAEKSRDAAVAKTYDALLNETRALRLAHKSGWRTQALQDLRTLAHLETPQRDLAELRGEAIACIGEFDAVEVMRFIGHTEAIWSLDFSPDGAELASAGYDGRVQIWDMNEGRHVREITDPDPFPGLRHNSAAMLPAVRFHPDGGRVASATWARGVGLGVAGDDQKTVYFGGPRRARNLAFTRRGSLLAVGWSDGRVSILDANTGAAKREVQTGVENNVHFPVALSPDGDLLAAVGPGNTVRLHRLNGDGEPITLGRHRNVIRSLCFSPLGDLIASASEDNTVKLWDVRGQGEPLTLLGHTARVNCVAFSPDGQLVATASDDYSVRLWAARDGQPVMALDANVGAVLAVAFGPDGRQLATAGEYPPTVGRSGDWPIRVYQLSSRQEQQQLAGHTFTIHGLTFHPVKPLLASESHDRNIILWDVRTGQPQQTWRTVAPNGPATIAFNQDGAVLAVGRGAFTRPDGTKYYTVELRDTETGGVRRKLQGPQAWVDSLAFDPPGRRLAAGTTNGTTYIWDTQTGAIAHQWKGPRSVVGLGFLDGGARLLTADAAGHVVIRDSAGGEPIRETILPGELTTAAILPGATSLVAADVDGSLNFLALPGLELSARIEKAHEGRISAIACSPSGRLLATGGSDCKVVLWDALSHQRLCSMPRKTGVNALAFDPDGLRLAVSSAEVLVTVWNLALVRPELAAVGLDWDGPRPETSLQPEQLAATPPPPIQVVRAPLKPVGQPATVEKARGLQALYRQGRFQEVVTAGEVLVGDTPGDKALYPPLTEAYYLLGQYDKATATVRRYLDQWPDNTSAKCRLADYRTAAGAPEESIEILERLLHVNPNHPLASNTLAWLFITGPERVQDAEKALPLAQRAVTLAPDTPHYNKTLGAVYYRLGKFDKAVETLLAVPRSSTNTRVEALTQLFLAMSYQRLGNSAKAKECFQQAPRPTLEDRLGPYQMKEVEAIRAEAAALLGVE